MNVANQDRSWMVALEPGGGRGRAAHNGYEFAPHPNQAASFVAGRVRGSELLS